MTPFTQAVYILATAVVVPALVAVMFKACSKTFNAIIDKGADRDWPDGFNGDERGFQ